MHETRLQTIVVQTHFAEGKGKGELTWKIPIGASDAYVDKIVSGLGGLQFWVNDG